MGVQKRYKTKLEEKLNQLNSQGFTIFERWELLHWFDQEKLSQKSVWGNIHDDYLEYDEDADLAIINCDQTAPPSRLLVIDKNRLSEFSDYTGD